jgi:hypothetical protein
LIPEEENKTCSWNTTVQGTVGDVANYEQFKEHSLKVLA